MLMRSTTRLRFLRLAIIAVLLNALAPAFASSLAASRPAVPTDVCSTHGGRALAVAAALLNQFDDDAGAAHAGNCGHCLAHAGHCGMTDGAALPLAPAFLLPRAAGHAVHAAAVHDVPHPLAQRAGAPPRGPPAFS